MNKILISALAILANFAAVVALPLAVQAQVQQSGSVTPGHVARWVTSGVITDGGAASSGSLTEIGVTKSGGIAIGVNSGAITGAYTQLGIGVTPGTGVQFNNTSFGGAAHIPFNFVVNGATVLSITDTGVLINGSSAVGTVTSVATGTGLTGGPITSSGTISLAAIANNTVLGNNTGASAAPTALTGTALSTLMGLGTASVKNASGSGATVASTSGSFTAGHIITAADANGTVQDGGTVPTGTITQVLAGTGLSGGGSTGSVTVSLSSPVAVSIGGTGATTLTNHGVLVGQATSAIVATAVGTAGQVLTSNGAGLDPTFQAVTGTGTVTSIATGSGLTGGTITTTGTIAFASVADLRILANISGGSAAPSANTLTAIIDAAIGSTRGSLLERGASGWALLTPGTVSLPLVSGGSGADPSYAALGVAGGGTGNTSFSAHQLLVATGATTITGKTVPDCQDTSGQHLNYTQSTDTFACGTSGGVATPVSVANGGTGISSGTSGGVLAFTASGTIASSGALALNGVVIGGGAGAVPTTITAGTDGQMLVGASSAAPVMRTLSGDVSSVSSLGAVTLSKVNGVSFPSSGTSGGIPYYSSTSAVASSAALTANLPVIGGGAGAAPAVGARSGNTTTFATTTGTLTSGHVATFDASGNINDGGAAPSSGSLVKISTQTASTSTELDFTGLGSTYTNYKMFCNLLSTAANTRGLFQFGEGGTPTWGTGANYDVQGHVDQLGAPTAVSATALTGVYVDANSNPGTAEVMSIEATFYNIPTAGVHKSMNITTVFAANLANYQASGRYTADTNAITAIRLITGTSNYASGACTLYGIVP